MTSDFDPTDYDDHLLASLREDAVDRDVTTNALPEPERPVEGRVIARERGVLAGLPLFERVFELLPRVASHFKSDSLTVRPRAEDGDHVEPDESILELTGPAQSVLAGERVALNYLQQLSGVASATQKLVDLADPHDVEVFDTRKTTPHHRPLQKYAVRQGGGHNHRMDLSEAVMVKDNHKELAEGLRNYLEVLETEKPVIVEVHNVNELPILEDFRASEDFDIEIVMLDNFEPSDLKTVTLNLPDEWAAEVSGGITLDNVQAYCSTGVDRISVGAVTHSFDSLDLSLKVTPSR